MMKVRTPCFSLFWSFIVMTSMETNAQTLPFRTDGNKHLTGEKGQDSASTKAETLKTPRGADTLKIPRGIGILLRDTGSTAAYWNHDVSMATLQNLFVSYATDRYSIYTELVSDYLNIFGVYSRIGFGCLVAASDSSVTHDSTSAAVQRLVGGGGNFLIQVSTPFMSFGGDRCSADGVFAPKFALDVPGANADGTEYSTSFDLGADLILTSASVSEKFRFFGQFRIGWIFGSGEFYRRLGLDAPFGAGKLLLGVDINNAVRVYATNVLVAPRILRDETVWQLGVQLLPH
jgi:hypothetical protein